jgi:hypothetical protein
MEPRTLYDAAVKAGLPMPGLGVSTALPADSPGNAYVYRIENGRVMGNASLADVCMAVIEGLGARSMGLAVVVNVEGKTEWRVTGKVGAHHPSLPAALLAACEAMGEKQSAVSQHD